MSTYVLMRILESAPHRYDLGIRLLTLGRLSKAYERLAGYVEGGQRVVDLGCGTGALTLLAAERGATVKGIDTNAQMLEIAVRRARDAGLANRIEFVEMGVAELDGEPDQSYDAVTSGLCFSELSEEELTCALRQVTRILKPGGLLLVADEVKPRSVVGRLLHSLIRAPLVALAYILTQQTTRPLSELSQKLTDAGLLIVSVSSSALGSFREYVTRKPGGALR